MSRIAKQPIDIPEGVDININNGFISIKGPKGEISMDLSSDINIKKDDDKVNIEFNNGMPEDIILGAKKKFDERLQKIDWETYYNSWPFNDSALALYKWAPIAEELKILDRKIVLNSMILKWDNIKDEFAKVVNI